MESGHLIDINVIESIHNQTGGQPFLVNRFGQIFTEEMKIPTDEPITMTHFLKAFSQLRREQNTNISHLTTNIRKDRRYEKLLWKQRFGVEIHGIKQVKHNLPDMSN